MSVLVPGAIRPGCCVPGREPIRVKNAHVIVNALALWEKKTQTQTQMHDCATMRLVQLRA